MKQGKMKQSVYASCFFLPDKDMLWPNGQSFPQPAHQSKSSLWVRRYFCLACPTLLWPQSLMNYMKENFMRCAEMLVVLSVKGD